MELTTENPWITDAFVKLLARDDAKNEEKTKEKRRLYYENNKEKEKERARLYYEKNKETM